jgi:hypothetical protein
MEEVMALHDAPERPVANSELAALGSELGRSQEDALQWAVALARTIAPELRSGRRLAVLNADDSLHCLIIVLR